MAPTKTGDAPTAGEAWSALQAALRAAEPLCRGDDRFTDDHADVEPLRAICTACPIRPECRAVAITSPTKMFGFAGGRVCRGVGR